MLYTYIYLPATQVFKWCDFNFHLYFFYAPFFYSTELIYTECYTPHCLHHFANLAHSFISFAFTILVYFLPFHSTTPFGAFHFFQPASFCIYIIAFFPIAQLSARSWQMSRIRPVGQPCRRTIAVVVGVACVFAFICANSLLCVYLCACVDADLYACAIYFLFSFRMFSSHHPVDDAAVCAFSIFHSSSCDWQAVFLPSLFKHACVHWFLCVGAINRVYVCVCVCVRLCLWKRNTVEGKSIWQVC